MEIPIYYSLYFFKEKYIADYGGIVEDISFLGYLYELRDKYMELSLSVGGLSDEEYAEKIELTEFIQKMLPYDFYIRLGILVEFGLSKSDVRGKGVEYENIDKKNLNKTQILRCIKDEFNYLDFTLYYAEIEKYLDIKLKQRGFVLKENCFLEIYYFIEKSIKKEEKRIIKQGRNILNLESILKENPPLDNSETSAVNNEIFKSKGAENLFFEFVEKHILDPYTDFSFIYQQMRELRLIERLTHFEFAEWLLSEKIISENVYEKISDNRGFKSLTKSTNANRLNDFLILKEKYLNTDFR